MAVGAGVSLLLLVALGRRIYAGQTVHRPAWAVAFATIGAIEFLLGLHMSLTWPLSGPTAFDNIVFGEPTLALGALLIAGSVLLGSQRFWPTPLGTHSDPATTDSNEISSESWPHLAKLLQPLSWFGAAMGLALIAIAFVGPVYSPWEAPPQEPISGEFGDVEWLENTFIALLYAVTGIGAVALPFALMRRTLARAAGLLRIVGACWLVTGAVFVGFGAMNYYTHIGLTINTYEESTQVESEYEAEPETEGAQSGTGP
ncbi:MAG: DUF981 family protein [Solirubrobacterales bacterium]